MLLLVIEWILFLKLIIFAESTHLLFNWKITISSQWTEIDCMSFFLFGSFTSPFTDRDIMLVTSIFSIWTEIPCFGRNNVQLIGHRYCFLSHFPFWSWKFTKEYNHTTQRWVHEKIYPSFSLNNLHSLLPSTVVY